MLIARQPILDHEAITFGYELLYNENILDPSALKVIDDSPEISLHAVMETLSGRRKIFIPFSEKLLLEGYWSLLPPERVIIQILDSVNPTAEVLDTCKVIRDSGYVIALDEFKYKQSWEPIIEIVAILKIDLKASSRSEVEAYARRYAGKRLKLLAVHVDTYADYRWARKLGFEYFQGYYFIEPQIIKTDKIPSSRLNKLRLVHATYKPDFDYRDAEEIIKHDPGLTVKFLKYVNSAAAGLSHEVKGIRQALALLGQRNIRKWISLLAVASFTEEKPRELLVLVIKRARFCELMTGIFRLNGHAQSLFLVGMFSLLDAIIDTPMDKLLDDIPLEKEIKQTLQGIRTSYTDVIELALSFETGNWTRMLQIIEGYHLSQELVIRYHLEAIQWAEDVLD